MTVAVSFCAFNSSGANVAVQEVAPTYVGFVYGKTIRIKLSRAIMQEDLQIACCVRSVELHVKSERVREVPKPWREKKYTNIQTACPFLFLSVCWRACLPACLYI